MYLPLFFNKKMFYVYLEYWKKRVCVFCFQPFECRIQKFSPSLVSKETSHLQNIFRSNFCEYYATGLKNPAVKEATAVHRFTLLLLCPASRLNASERSLLSRSQEGLTLTVISFYFSWVCYSLRGSLKLYYTFFAKISLCMLRVE